MTASALPAGRGRPRSERAEAAILDAALQMLAEEGFGRITMEALATRAGVGKTTIYRRWKTKGELMIDAVMRVSEPAARVDTGDIRADLVTIVDAARRKIATSVAGAIMPRLMSAAMDDPELMQVYWERAVLPRRRLARERVCSGIARGELRAGLDPDLLCDAVFGPMVYRKLFAAVRPGPTRAQVEAFVDLALAGAVPR